MRLWAPWLCTLALAGPSYSVGSCHWRDDGVIGQPDERWRQQQEPQVPRRPVPTLPERVVHPALTEHDLRTILYWHRHSETPLGTDEEREVHDMLVLYLCWLIRANGGVVPPDCDMDPSELEPASTGGHTDAASGAG